ncbi:zinc finger protein 544-like isoform X2 [Pleurodeles waltl]|uniref:zinc finger protein 544-like isoform X2 n=1 Tax=Pleurodeles waltl TaxID=8319 RepID=UPI0037094DF0
MSWQDSDKAPVTFRDVAAYFSQEEWKLLHEWQKELYKNIMNDIQQALISLGPLVAASVFSLRSKEKEDVCLVNCQESEQIPSVNNFPGDVINSEDLIFRIHAEENLLIRNPLDLERDKKNDCVNTGYPVHNPEIGLRKDAESSASLMEEPGVKLRGGSADPSRGHAITTSLVSVCPKKEGADYIMDRSDCERRESSAPPSAGYPYPKTDFALRNEEAATVCLIDHYDVEEQEMRMNPIKGHAVTPLDISVCIKEEEEVYSVEHHDIERMDSGSSPTGVSTVISFSVKEEDRHHPIDQQETGEEERIINPAGGGHSSMKNTDGHALACKEQRAAYKIAPEQVDVFRSSETQMPTLRKLCSEIKNEVEEEKTVECELGSRKATSGIFCQEFSKAILTQENNKCESHLRNTHLTYQQDIQPHWLRPEVGKGSVERTDMIIHERRKGEMSYLCTKCGKKFTRRENLMIHQKLHMGLVKEKRYKCSECEKSFSHKGNFMMHQRTHAGEKPYQCTQCEKRFNRKGNLIRHYRTHTGEKPYKCTYCEKSFSQKRNVIAHQTTHICNEQDQSAC